MSTANGTCDIFRRKPENEESLVLNVVIVRC
nr:MAG TPA: hypothetical protein [Bacteriophage sp.]